MTESSFPHLITQLRRWNGRRLRRDGLLWLPKAVLAGLMLAVVVATVSRLRPLLDNQQVAIVGLTLGLVGLVSGLVIVFARRYSVRDQAKFADKQFRLKERVVTAVEIHEGVLLVPDTIAQEQLADTCTAIDRVDVKHDLPYRLDRRDWLFIALSIGLLLMAYFLPNPQQAILEKARAIEKAVAEQIESLEAIQEEILENPTLTEEQKEDLLQPVESALEALNAGAASQEQTVATLSEAEADLKQLAADNDTSALQQRLQEAGQPLAQNSAGQQLGQSLQNGDLFSAAAAAAQLADTLPNLTAEEQAALAQDLAETAQALQDVDAELAQQFADAAQALQNGDTAAAQQALRDAAGTLQQRGQQSAASQQAQSAAGQMAEGRQSVAQAGQQGEGQQGTQTAQGTQSGQGQQGQGQQGQGQGTGEGQGEGSGLGQGAGQGAGGQQGQGAGGPGPGGGHAENVFVPEFRDLSSTEGIEIELPAECIADPSSCGALLSETATEFGNEGSVVPYNQVFGDYRNAASEALADDYIPLGMKGYIRDYFSSLEP
ncbi:MAG: hypothetical protein IAF02_16565 [Anaerolineae bacterium]|nr:hypothetical protein [Anaerolineae bacterium]